MEGFYEKILEVIAQYGVFAVLFVVVLILLYRKYENDVAKYHDDIKRYREREENVDRLILASQENIAKSLSDVARCQEKITTCIESLNLDFRVFMELQKVKHNGRRSSTRK